MTTQCVTEKTVLWVGLLNQQPLTKPPYPPPDFELRLYCLMVLQKWKQKLPPWAKWESRIFRDQSAKIPGSLMDISAKLMFSVNPFTPRKKLSQNWMKFSILAHGYTKSLYPNFFWNISSDCWENDMSENRHLGLELLNPRFRFSTCHFRKTGTWD